MSKAVSRAWALPGPRPGRQGSASVANARSMKHGRRIMNRRVMAAAVSLAPRSLRWWWRRRAAQRASWAPWSTHRSRGRVRIRERQGHYRQRRQLHLSRRRDGELPYRRLALGAAKPQDRRVSPLELVGTANTSDARVIRMLRTLQSLDSTATPRTASRSPKRFARPSPGTTAST